MKKIAQRLFLLLFTLTFVGCTTTGTFIIPEGSALYLYERPDAVHVGSEGKVLTKPYFWTAAGIAPHGGIPYRLEKDGDVLKEGRLRAKFRVSSVFWPPFSFVYWPIGLNPDITYDLIEGTQE